MPGAFPQNSPCRVALVEADGIPRRWLAVRIFANLKQKLLIGAEALSGSVG
jgi:hypothetical protein